MNNTIPRFGERPIGEYYSTPVNFVDACIRSLPAGKAIDLCAGEGEFANQYQAVHNQQCDGLDVMSRPSDFAGIWHNCLLQEFKRIGDYSVIMMNPPFRHWLEFVMLVKEQMRQDAVFGVFARISVLEGKERYNTLWKDSMPKEVIIYDSRIKTGNSTDSIGRCFIIFGKSSCSDTKLRIVSV